MSTIERGRRALARETPTPTTTIEQAARDLRTLANALQLVLEDLSSSALTARHAIRDQIAEAVRIAETLEQAARPPQRRHLITNAGVEPCTVMGPSRNPPGTPGGEPEIQVKRSVALPCWVHPFLVRETSDEALQMMRDAAYVARVHTDDDAWLGHGKTIEQIIIERVAAQLRGTGD